MIIAGKKKKDAQKVVQTAKNVANKVAKKGEYFDDGYQVGDVTKSILATGGNALSNIGKGFIGTTEGVADTLTTVFGDLVDKSAKAQASIWELFGNDDYAQSLRQSGSKVKKSAYENAKTDVTSAIFDSTQALNATKYLLGDESVLTKKDKNWSESLSNKSIAGDLLQSAEQGIGNIGGFVGLGALTGGSTVGTFATSFVSSYGNTLTNDLRNGASEKDAKGHAISSGFAEAISEQFFQGIPGLNQAGWADNLVGNSVQKYFGSKAGKAALKIFDSAGEGFEEIISNMLEATFEGIRNGKSVKEIFSDASAQGFFNNEQTRDAFFSAIISSAITNGASNLISNQQKQSVLKAYAEENNISTKQAQELFDSLVEKKSSLEDTKNFKEQVETQEGIEQGLINELRQAQNEEQQVDLNELLNQTPNSRQEMQFALDQDEVKNIKSDKQKVLADDMARLNNVKENHELFKTVNAIQGANSTQQYHITTTEGLYEMGIVNKDANGNYTMPDGSPYVPRGLNYKDGDIYINADVGNQSGTQAMYHEMFEGFKKASPNEYNEFKQMVTDIIGEEAIQSEYDTYKSMYGEELTDDIRDEIINDKFGELAESEQFINKIADNRTVLQKFIDTVRDMIKYVKGTQQERELIKLQKKLENKFSELYKETDFSGNKGETAYSITKDSQGRTLSKEQQEYFKDSKVVDKNGNLRVLYNGSGEHTVYNPAYMSDESIWGKGIYLTPYKEIAEQYGNDIKEAYVDIKNPLVPGKSITFEQYNNLYQAINDGEQAYREEYDMYDDDLDLLWDITNKGSWADYADEIIKYTGKDGIIVDNPDADMSDQMVIAFKSSQIKNIDNTTPTTNPDIRYSLTKDNTGRELSKGQRDYFKDSKAVDDDGNLVTVYHTTTDETIQFNEFDPVGTPYYKFGEQVVNYFTDSKEMSGSYADQYYEMADTKKLESISDAKSWLKGITDDLYINNNNVYDIDGELQLEYKTSDELLRNLKSDIQRTIGEEAKLQYQGYVNITNPYVIDAEGRYWNKVESKGDTELTKKLISIPADVKEYLNNLASDSIHTYNENLFNWEQADRAVRDFATDRKNTTLEQRMLNRSIHEMEYETFMKVLDGNGRWGENIKFMDVLYNNDLITPTEKQQFDKSDGTIPTEIRDKIREKINEPVKYEDGFIKRELEVLGIPAEIKETTLNDLWKTRDEAYKTFDEGGRTEDVKFINTMLAQESEYSKYGVDVDTLFDTAKHKFTDDYIRDRHNDWSVTNDIVKKIIDLNGYGENYDGVIMKNVVDYGGDAKNKAPHDLYITFNSNQFKAVDNLNPTEDADIRYSMTSNENIDSKEIAPIGSTIRENLSNLNNKIDNLSNQLKTIQNGLENTSQGYVETYNEQRNENIPTRQLTEEDANTLQDALMNDEGYLRSLDEQANLDTENTKLIDRLTNNVTQRLDLEKGQKETLRNIVKESIENGYSADEISEALQKEFSQMSYEMTNQEAVDARKLIRDIPIKVSDAIKTAIADYGKWKSSNFGKINFSNSGSPVDSVYAELNNKMPYFFPSDIVNPTDQLLKIAEVANMATKVTETFDIDADEFDNIADYIKNTVLEDEYNAQMNSQDDLDKNIQFNMTDDIAPTTIRTQENIDDYIENRDIAPVRQDIGTRRNNSPLRDRIETIRRRFGEMITNRNYEIDKVSKATGNRQIKFAGDMLNSVSGEVQYNINNFQTDMNGNIVGKSVAEIFAPSKKAGLYEAFNDYLIQKSNIERHNVGKGSQVPLAVSQQLVNQYEIENPQFKEWAKDVYKYFDNVLQEQVDAGLITEERYNDYRGEDGIYRSYVPFYAENIDTNRFFDNEGKVKPVSTLKRSKGEATDVNQLLAVEDSMAKQTYAYKKAIRQNELFSQIVSSLDKYTEAMDMDVRDNPTNLDDVLYTTPDGDKVLSAYINGEKTSAKISDELFNELSGENEARIKQLEQDFSLLTKPLQKVSNVRRNILTSWNPTFLARNAIKDIQDAVINSKYTKDMLKNYFGLEKGKKSAVFELREGKTKEAQQFLALYGAENLYGDYSNVSKNSGIKGLLSGDTDASLGVINKFARANELIELAPRFAEFKASLENGASVQEAMYNAREVTTNFGRGGYITKALNRNGFTFLNANVQGLDKFIRNISGENGVKGVTSVVVKGAAFAVLPSILNHLLYGLGDDKDEEYEALPDYIKDNYYLIKTEGNNFVRIPKGRINAAFGSVARRTIEALEGEENAYEGWANNAWDQLGVGDLGGNNILAPITQAFGSQNGTAWYGGDIVPTRLQDKPAAEQTDAKIDAVSNTIGEIFNVSPYKVNYVIDQYSGGLGDILLPMITPETKSGAETPVEYLTAPIKDAFVVNSTDDNKYAGEFYNLKDKLEIQSNSSKATDDDKIRYKYMSNISKEMSELYKERREVQADTTLGNKEKYAKVQAIQNEINSLAKEGLSNYKNATTSENYSNVNDSEYYKNAEGKWEKVTDDESEFTAGLNQAEKDLYYKTKNKIGGITQEYTAKTKDLDKDDPKKKEYSVERKENISQAVINSGLDDYTKAMVYAKYYSSKEAMTNAVNAGYNIDTYITALNDIEQLRETYSKDNGYTTEQRKAKTIAYIDSLDMEVPQKAMLIRNYYTSYRTYNNDIVNYVSNLNIPYEDKEAILKGTGMTVNGNNVSWK